MTDEALKPIVRMRAVNHFVTRLDDEGKTQYQSVGYRYEFLRDGSDVWEPIEVEMEIVNDAIIPADQINNNPDPSVEVGEV